jgi:hypothetical protein
MRWQIVEVIVPAEPVIAWSTIVIVIVALHVFLFLAAAWSVMTSPRLTRGGRLLWLLVLIALPFLGAIAWFLWGRHARLDRAA